MSFFDPKTFLSNGDLVGPGKLFGSKPGLDAAVKNRGFPPGRMIGNQRKRTGQEVNDWIEQQPVEAPPLAEGMGRSRLKRQAIKPTNNTAA
jgi:hypothetical protein